MDESERTTT